MNAWLREPAAGLPPSIESALRLPRWPLIIALAGVLVVVSSFRRPTSRAGTWSPTTTGLALGAVGTLAWLTGSMAGWHWGLSITGPSRSLAEATVLGMPEVAGWGTAMVIGIPLGAWASARARSRIVWRVPSRGEMLRRIAGGVLMGVGGTWAAGCNIGNALTGLSVLSAHSAIATGAIAAGVAGAVAIPGIVRIALGSDAARNRT